MSLWVIGIGPGDIDYITPLARKKIIDSDFVVGSSRAVRSVRDILGGKQTRIFDGKSLEDAMKFSIEKARELNVALLSTGDPCFSGVLKPIRRKLRDMRTEIDLEVIPGISSIQVLSSRLGVSWDEMDFVNFHGAQNLQKALSDLATALRAKKSVLVFPDPRLPPGTMAGQLMAKGAESYTRVVVGSELTYPTERIYDTDLEGLTKIRDMSPLSIMVIDPNSGLDEEVLERQAEKGAILVGHGSRLSYNKEVIEKLASELEEKGYEIRSGLLLEPSTVHDAIAELARANVPKIALVPIFTADGMHTKRDLPEILRSLPGVTFVEEKKNGRYMIRYFTEDQSFEVIMASPIGSHPRVIDIVEERIEEALGELQ